MMPSRIEWSYSMLGIRLSAATGAALLLTNSALNPDDRDFQRVTWQSIARKPDPKVIETPRGTLEKAIGVYEEMTTPRVVI